MREKSKCRKWRVACERLDWRSEWRRRWCLCSGWRGSCLVGISRGQPVGVDSTGVGCAGGVEAGSGMVGEEGGSDGECGRIRSCG